MWPVVGRRSRRVDGARSPAASHAVCFLCALCVSAVSAFSVAACSTPPRSTQLQTLDFESIVVEVTQSLQSSDFLKERTPESPEILLTFQKPTNLTSDLLHEGEKWYLVDRVTHSLMFRDLSKAKRIRTIIPAERLEGIEERDAGMPIGSERAPTHVMTAVLRNVTRTAGRDRTDLYAAGYQITQIQSGETVWTGEYLLKRSAIGRAYN